jgi:hypothetical protein
MTTIEQIKQELRDIIELSDKATPGPWDNENGPYVYAHIPGGRPNGEYIMQVYCGNGAGKPLGKEMNKCNASFITASRNLTPKMARALLGMINALEHDEANDAPITRRRATIRLEAIRREWEVQPCTQLS